MSVINVKTLGEFNNYLISNTYVIAIFSASFCKPCKEIYPFIEELSTANTNITFLKIDIEDGWEISDNYNISSIPYFKFYRSNIEITSYCGADKRLITEALSQLISYTDRKEK
jgi:thioredoxin 1